MSVKLWTAKSTEKLIQGCACLKRTTSSFRKYWLYQNISFVDTNTCYSINCLSAEPFQGNPRFSYSMLLYVPMLLGRNSRHSSEERQFTSSGMISRRVEQQEAVVCVRCCLVVLVEIAYDFVGNSPIFFPFSGETYVHSSYWHRSLLSSNRFAIDEIEFLRILLCSFFT